MSLSMSTDQCSELHLATSKPQYNIRIKRTALPQMTPVAAVQEQKVEALQNVRGGKVFKRDTRSMEAVLHELLSHVRPHGLKLFAG